MSASLTDAIKEKLTKIADSAPNLGKIVIVGDGEVKEQIDAIVTFAQGLGIEVSVEPRESVAEAIEKAAELHSISFEISELGEDAAKLFESDINTKGFEIQPVIMESSKRIFDEQKNKQREHMKQMQRYQNKHWRK